jgi:UDP-N-acetylglucosamine 2-epimerase (non-hydrolysing)
MGRSPAKSGVARPRLMIVFGTRPEAIKIAPVAIALRAMVDRFETVLCSTGQHRELLGLALQAFGLVPDVHLDVMRPRQSLAGLTGRLLAGVDEVYGRLRPDLVIVQGDTTTAFVGALAAYYRKIPIAHVEAGLRTDDLSSPFPEEGNRRLITSLASVHFAPTPRAETQLIREGVPPADVFVTGNTVIDALMLISERDRNPKRTAPRSDGPTILVTMHRRESYGTPFEDICRAIRFVADSHPRVSFLIPTHPSPNVQRPVHEMLGSHPRIRLIGSLAYPDFVTALSRCHFVLTDSGGIQEEAPALAKPVLVMRDTTERPEAITAGTARLVGTSTNAIVAATEELLLNPSAYNRMARAINPFGDGRAAHRVAGALSYRYGFISEPPAAFLMSRESPVAVK